MASCASIVEGVRVRLRALILLALAFATASIATAAAGTVVFGPETFTRAAGPPVTVTRTFRVRRPAPHYTLRVTNHGVRRAEIAVNGRVVVSPADFHTRHNRERDGRRDTDRDFDWDCDRDDRDHGRHDDDNDDDDAVPLIERTITLRDGQNTLAVEVRGKRGHSLTIEIVESGVSDTTPPVITAAASPSPNANGWNNSDVTVTFTCSDAGSGIATCPSPVIVTAEGANQTISGTAVDKAGNQATATVHVSLDKTAPIVAVAASPAANANGWNNGPVTVHFTCADAGAGIATCPADQTVSAEGATPPITGTATDKAGNTATAVTAAIQIDRGAPTITAAVTPRRTRAAGTAVR